MIGLKQGNGLSLLRNDEISSGGDSSAIAISLYNSSSAPGSVASDKLPYTRKENLTTGSLLSLPLRRESSAGGNIRKR